MSTVSRELLLNAMDMLPDAVCVVDAEGHFLFVNAACEQLLGYRPAEMIGLQMMDLVLPEDRPKTARAVEQIMEGVPLSRFENRYVRKDGRVVHIMWSARWSEEGGFRLAIARDMTEHSRSVRIQNALYQISEAAHHTDGLTALFARIHAIVSHLVPLDTFFVALYDKDGDALSYPYFSDESGKLDLDPFGDSEHSAEVIRAGRSVLRDSSQSPDGAMQAGRGDWLGVPLLSQEGVIGAIVVESRSQGVRYSVEDKDLLEFVSVQITSAIERKQSEARMLHMARHDSLTGLANRTLFHDALDLALKRARRDNEFVGLLFVDLDQFKQVNDNFGHEVGARLLQEAAQRLRGCMRESDMVGRMGGDEFTVLMSNLRNPDNAAIVAEKVLAVLQKPFEIDGREVGISASVGMAIYPRDGLDRETLLRAADTTMYARKRANR